MTHQGWSEDLIARYEAAELQSEVLMSLAKWNLTLGPEDKMAAWSEMIAIIEPSISVGPKGMKDLIEIIAAMAVRFADHGHRDLTAIFPTAAPSPAEDASNE